MAGEPVFVMLYPEKGLIKQCLSDILGLGLCLTFALWAGLHMALPVGWIISNSSKLCSARLCVPVACLVGAVVPVTVNS